MIYFVTSLLFLLCYAMVVCIKSNYGSIKNYDDDEVIRNSNY